MTYIPALKHHPLFHCLLALPVIFLVALANDNANAQNFAAEWAAECNARVGSPYEPENLGTGRGLELADVDGYAAYYYCKEAYTAAPETPSNIYRMARVFHTRNQSGPALNYYNTAANLGYLPAQHDVGIIHTQTATMGIVRALKKKRMVAILVDQYAGQEGVEVG